MARNAFGDLANHLFEQLERLNDEGLKGENLEEERKQAESMCAISKQLLGIGRMELEFKKLIKNQKVEEVPALFKGAEIKTKKLD